MTDAALHIHPTGHDHAACVDEALETAETLCVERGARLTPLRRRVLELVWSSHRPVGAYDILGKLDDGARKPAPPTVYRALDTLVSLGLAHRIPSLNAYTACRLDAEGHAPSFLICDCCGAAEEFAAPIEAVLNAIRAGASFTPAHIAVEAHGRCKACQG